MKKIIEILKDKKQTIACMESCTGGMLASEITNIDGSSDVKNVESNSIQASPPIFPTDNVLKPLPYERDKSSTDNSERSTTVELFSVTFANTIWPEYPKPLLPILTTT